MSADEPGQKAGKGLVRLETPKGSARRKPVKRFRRKRPFLENSTACQKSTPDMLIPRLSREMRFLCKYTARTLCAIGIIPPDRAALVVFAPSTGKHSRRV